MRAERNESTWGSRPFLFLFCPLLTITSRVSIERQNGMKTPGASGPRYVFKLSPSYVFFIFYLILLLIMRTEWEREFMVNGICTIDYFL